MDMSVHVVYTLTRRVFSDSVCVRDCLCIMWEFVLTWSVIVIASCIVYIIPNTVIIIELATDTRL